MAEFTYQWLEDYLSQVQQNWTLCPLREWQGGGRRAILRHDVDLDLEPALELARRQAQRGWRATYCILTTSDSYNPFSSQGRRLLREIAACGAEIALHFDPKLYEPPDWVQAAREEARQLESVIGEPVLSLSLHSPHALAEIPCLEGFINAYDPAIFGPGRYLSDSCRRFRTPPEQFLQQAPELLQLLFHPLHFSEVERDYPEIFQDQIRRWLGRVDQEYRTFNENYRRAIPQPLPG